MKAYFDTSFLVPLFIPEKESERVELHIQGLDEEMVLTVSHWTVVEMASVFSRLVRMRELGKSTAKKLDRAMSRVFEASFEIVTPQSADFRLCRNYLNSFDNSLRAGDALHLAIAANQGSDLIFSLDKTMLAAGAALGLTLSDGR